MVPNTLPPEILSDILIAHVAACMGEDTQTPYSWLPAISVCRYWRTLALETPLIWRRIAVTHNSYCIHTMLARSKQVPLYVTARFTNLNPWDSRLASFGLVMDQVDRIASVHLSLASHIFLPSAILSPLSLASQMGALSISIDGGDKSSTHVTASLRPLHPRLKRLELYGFTMSDSCSLMGAYLRHLVIHTKSVGGVFHTMGSLLSVLRRMNELASFSLDIQLADDSWRETSQAYSGLPTVTIPSLQSISLRCHIGLCKGLLSHLNLPSVNSITYRPSTYHRDHNLALISVVSAKLFSSRAITHPITLQSLSISPVSTTHFAMIGWSQELSRHKDEPHKVAPIFDVEFSAEYPELSLRETCKMLPTSQIRHLSVFQLAPWVVGPRISLQLFLDVYGCMSQVRTLSVWGWSALDLADILEARVGSGPCDMVFPHLTHLHLDYIQFREFPPMVPYEDPEWFDRFREALECRRERLGWGLNVSFVRCVGLRSTTALSLEGVVGSIAWQSLDA